MRTFRVIAFVAALLLSASLIHAAEQETVENPAYKVWTKFGIGSSQTSTGEMQAGPNKLTTETKRTLAEKADDHITLDIASSVDVLGQHHDEPAHQVKIPAKAEKKDVQDLGTEDVTAAGKTFKCHVYEAKGFFTKNPEAKVKVWVNEEVPGGLVKMEASSPRGSLTMLLKSYEAK